jgi:1-deoxy-D-xylulose-5-phosphate reductoisomerase
MKKVAIAGSTGSIGVSALEVIASHPERLSPVALAAGRNMRLLAEQVRRFRPRLVSVGGEKARQELRELLGGEGPDVMTGVEGAEAVATYPDAEIFLSAIVGAAGVRPTYSAVAAGKQVALANKESLVVAGEPIMAEAARCQVEILPVDSEHNALHQCLRGGKRSEVRRLILTASGGPFRETPAEEMTRLTPEQALKHPTWEMGRKITIDSATLMNKGLEVIEARWLFGLAGDRISVVIHPQSTVHSLVEFTDGSVLAQLGVTDMRLPIRYALSYPERWEGPEPALDLARAGRLDFEEVDRNRFPCLDLGYRALREGGTAPAVLNAANEVAVESFLEGKIRFTSVPELIERTLDRSDSSPGGSLEEFLEADRWARSAAMELVERRAVA